MIADQLSLQSHNADDMQPDGMRGQQYSPQSPFLAEPQYLSQEAENLPITAPSVGEQLLTPFPSEYALDSSPVESTDAAIHRQIMAEIFDTEFEESLENLVSSLREVHQNQFAGQDSADDIDSEALLTSYVAPLAESIENLIDRMVAEIAPIDNEALEEQQLESFLEGFQAETRFQEPEFEEFFKKIFKKIKKVAKKGFKVLKKVGKAALKFTPIGLILRKLKKLVKPLLRRVLKFALNKVPARYRPLARKLARRFLKGALGELNEDYSPEELLFVDDASGAVDAYALDENMSAPPVQTISAEIDSMITGYLMDGEDFEFTPEAVQFYAEEQFEGAGSGGDIERARDRFISQLAEMDDDADPEPEVEQFVSAILAGLKIGIRLIGRRRVVNFLAKLVARLIRRFVGKRNARPLSRALVDAGLRLVNLESPEESQVAVAEVLAETVEEAIEDLARNAPLDSIEDVEELEGFVTEAFEKAAARNFPQATIRADLRLRTRSKGAWILRSRRGRPRRYKKYTRVLDVTVAPKTAENVKTFGDKTLKSFLKERLGLPADKQPIKARMHLFEVMRGTRLSDITAMERNIGGLGSARRKAIVQLHPLTCHAASLLIPEDAALCRDVPKKYRVSRGRTAVGQRVYYLEIPGARVLETQEMEEGESPGAMATLRPVRTSELNVELDFQAKKITIYNYLSEAASMEIASLIRSGKPFTAVHSAIRKTLGTSLQSALSGEPTVNLRVKREMPSPENFVARLAPILKFSGEAISKLLSRYLAQALFKTLKANYQSFSQAFVKATDSAADGTTLIMTVTDLDEVFAALTGGAKDRTRAIAALHTNGISGSLKLDVRAGFHRE